MHSAGEASGELSTILAELEAVKAAGAAPSAELIASLHSRIEQAAQQTGAAAQQHAIRQADARAANFLSDTQGEVNALWSDASERYGHLLTEEEQRAYRDAALREQQALEHSNTLAALDARSDRLTITRDLYARAGDADGAERADALLDQTQAQQRAALEARGLSANDAISTAASHSTEQGERDVAAQGHTLDAFLSSADLATDTIALDECDSEITCPPTPPATPTGRGRG